MSGIKEGGADVSRNPWLDICRALAILLVLLSHGRVFLRPALPWTDYLRFGGFMGVELFFVLSGFLIGGILIHLARGGGVHWLKGFYARRWFRTLPNYYLFLIINIGLVWLGVRVGGLDRLWQYPLFLQSLFWPHPVFFAEAWSLAVEEVFYLLFPILFLAMARIFRLDIERAILFAALLVIGASLLARMAVADTVVSWDDDLRKIAFLRFDTLMFGVLLAWLRARGGARAPGLTIALVVMFVLASVYFAVTPDAELAQSTFAKTLYFSLASLGCVGLIIIGLEWRPPTWLATISGFLARVSYSAYLVNIPVAMGLVRVLGCCDSGLGSALSMWLAFMCLTLLISYGVYRFYEGYFNALRDRLYPR